MDKARGRGRTGSDGVTRSCYNKGVQLRTPFFLLFMATSKESEFSQEFIKSQKLLYGPDLYIKKYTSAYEIGEPDIYSVYKGMPLYAESKTINSISLKNIHPFKEIQINNLKEKAKAGAFCIGLLLMKNKYKYLIYDKLHEHITPEEYKNAPEFNYEKIYQEWKQMILKG